MTESGLALHGRRVVITRSVADNLVLASELEAHGAQVVAVPLVEVRPPVDDGAELRAAVDQIDQYRWIVVTSVNGVDAMQQALAGRSVPDGITVMPVGPVTAAAAAAHGMPVGPVPPVATAQSLVDAFPQREAGERSAVLAPLAELAGPTITQGLSDKGYDVHRVTAYRTEAPAAASAREMQLIVDQVVGADAVALYSPSAVDRLVSQIGTQLGTLPPIVAVCVGPATAARAGEHGFVEVITAEPHTSAGVVEAILSRFNM